MSATHVQGVASVTRLAAPPPIPRQPGVQGTLALELIPRQSAPEHVELRAIDTARGDLESFTRRFCVAVVEVLSGDRGPAQMLHWLTPPVYDHLVNRSRALACAGGTDQRLRRVRTEMLSVHVFSPCPGAAEFSLHVRHGMRSRAIAGRLEVRHGAWTCVVLQFG